MKFSISEVSNDDVSGTGRPLNFVIDSGVGFSGLLGSNGATFDCIKSKMAVDRHVEISVTISLERVVRSISCLILAAYCQQRANHIVYRFVHVIYGRSHKVID